MLNLSEQRVFVLFILLGLSPSGCGGFRTTCGGKESTAARGIEDQRKKADLIGKWKNTRWTSTIQFTSEGTVIFDAYDHHHVGGYDLNNGLFKITKRAEVYSYALEFVSKDEFSLRQEKRHSEIFSFGDLDDGTWRRIPPPSPIEEANVRRAEFEEKRAALKSLREKAVAERDDLRRQLRDAGITKPGDLKDNLLAQKLAGSLVKIEAELAEWDRQIAMAETAILDTRALVRLREGEKASISNEEVRNLAEQLRERADSTAKLVTPVDVQTAVERALKDDKPGLVLTNRANLLERAAALTTEKLDLTSQLAAAHGERKEATKDGDSWRAKAEAQQKRADELQAALIDTTAKLRKAAEYQARVVPAIPSPASPSPPSRPNSASLLGNLPGTAEGAVEHDWGTHVDRHSNEVRERDSRQTITPGEANMRPLQEGRNVQETFETLRALRKRVGEIDAEVRGYELALEKDQNHRLALHRAMTHRSRQFDSKVVNESLRAVEGRLAEGRKKIDDLRSTRVDVISNIKLLESDRTGPFLSRD